MSESAQTQSIAELWQRLAEAGLTDGKPAKSDTSPSPWFVKLILAFSGWLAAVFILGSIGLASFRFLENPVACLVTGCVFIFFSFCLIKIEENAFAENLGLAISIAGQCLVIFGLVGMTDLGESGICLVVFALQMFLCFLMPSYTHRVLSAFFAMLALYLALALQSLSPLFYGPVLLVCMFLWLNEFNYPSQMQRIRPVGYGFVLALVFITGTRAFSTEKLFWIGSRLPDVDLWILQLITQLLITVAMLYLAVHLLRRYKVRLFSRAGIISVLSVMGVSLLSLLAPGVAIGISIMLLGFANAHRLLTVFGVVTLIFYTSSYYYQLDTTLLVKSLSMLALGVALLIGRRMLPVVIPPRGKHA